MFEACVIRGRRITPARFCAPLAGYTHSAFRRLLADFGGCGAVWTEMLAARQIPSENFLTSPWLRRRPQDGLIVYQLMVGADDALERPLAWMAEHGVEAIDLNLACDSRSVRSCTAGSALFENLSALRDVLTRTRRLWSGVLTAKIRLGSRRPDWRPGFVERLRLLEDAGVDAVTLHPRFFEDKFKRHAQHDLVEWAASLSPLPLIANGDLGHPEQVRARAAQLSAASGIMLGRMAVACPWVFAAWDGLPAFDYAEVWRRMHRYIVEDFPPTMALRRLQMFTKYYAVNFLFGHSFNVDVSHATSCEDALRRAEAFFAPSPAICPSPRLFGR